MQVFELTLPASPAWVDLARDLVATGAGPLDLGLDRLNDLLVLTEHVCSQALHHPGAISVEVALAVDSSDLRLTVETMGATQELDRVSELVMSVMANEHWHSATEAGSLIGFRLRS